MGPVNEPQPSPRAPTEPSVTERLLAANREYAAREFAGMLPLRPSLRLAVVACMDSRMPIFRVLGLKSGEAHIIRNAGGVITDDVIRSLVLSQRFMGTREIVLVHHTDCGLTKISEDQLRAELERDTGLAPRFTFEAFQDPYANVRQSLRRVHLSPYLAHRDRVRGFVYAVETGLLQEVHPE
jgi:carbonic anhydrase